MVPIKKRALEGMIIPIKRAIALRILVQIDSMNMEIAVANQSKEYLSFSFSLLINSKVTISIEIEIVMDRILNPIGISHPLLLLVI